MTMGGGWCCQWGKRERGVFKVRLGEGEGGVFLHM